MKLRNRNSASVIIMVVLMILIPMVSIAQDSGCRVLMPSIADTYKGNCKNGLAQGKGEAQGVDHYIGRFYRGLPEGPGTYIWANGNWYEGQWTAGLMEGRGKMVYKVGLGDSVVVGYWSKDKYIGTERYKPYMINRSVGIIRTSFNKMGDDMSDIKIRFMIGGRINSDIQDLSIANDSGSEYRSGNFIGIMNATFPVSVKIRYRTWNQIHSMQSECVLEFTIDDPGRWDVTITN